MNSVLQDIAELLVLPILVFAVALFVKGGTAPGGAFSAGVVAGLVVGLLHLAFDSRVRQLAVVRGAPFIAAGGLLLSIAVTFAPVFFGDAPATHIPPADTQSSHFGTLELRTQMLFEFGVMLAVFGFSARVMSLVALVEEER